MSRRIRSLRREGQLETMSEMYRKSLQHKEMNLIDQREEIRERSAQEAQVVLAKALHTNNQQMMLLASDAVNRVVDNAKWGQFLAKEHLEQQGLQGAVPILTRCMTKVIGNARFCMFKPHSCPVSQVMWQPCQQSWRLQVEACTLN